jgi:hypothetical protein
MVKEGFRPEGKEQCQCLSGSVLLALRGPPRAHPCSYLQVWGAADVGVVHGAHLRISGVGEVAKGLGMMESLLVHSDRRACAEGRTGSEPRSRTQSWGTNSPALPQVTRGLILCGMASVPVRDFLFLILIVLPFSPLGLRTSFFWDSEHENPRISPGENEAS